VGSFSVWPMYLTLLTGTSVSDSAAPGVGSRAAQLASTADGGLSSRGPNPN
jgi:hypothetical protein